MYALFWKNSKLISMPNLEKRGIDQSEVEFLGYIIPRNGVHMDLHKVQTIVDWATPAFV
jgi:hypothetical protein